MAVLAGTLAACGASTGVPVAETPASPASPAASSPSTQPSPDRSGTGLSKQATAFEDDLLARMPVTLNIPDAPPMRVIASTTLADGAMSLPTSGQQAAWRTGGASPGDAEGVVLLAGHVDTRNEGKGAFAKLSGVNAGDSVSIETYSGAVQRYEVDSAPVQFGKSELPDYLFATTGKPRLALITCSGAYDRKAGAYPNNLVVWATPISG